MHKVCGEINGQKLFELDAVTEYELTRRFKQAHDSLWGGGELNPSEAFDELDKLIFCKIWDERKPRKKGEPYDFQIFSENTESKTNKELQKRINNLYAEGRKKDPEVFKDDIRLNPEKLRTVVGYLESIHLGNTDLDSKGRAFEAFMGSFFKGDFRQYESHNALVYISRLKQEHIFIVSLDDVDYWYRYHHLLSQYLHKKLLEIYSDEIDVLHASQQLDRIWQWLIIWQFDKARIALGEVRATLDEWQDDTDGKYEAETLKFMESKYAHREMSYAFFSDRASSARLLAQDWLKNHLNKDLSMVSSAKTMLMVAERDHFILEDIAAKVDVLHDLHVEANFSYGVMKGDCLCGATLAMQGDLDAAEIYFERARNDARALHGESAPLTAMPSLQLAELYYERDQLPEAGKLIRKYLPLSQSFGFAENIIAGFMIKARLEYCKNNTARALQVIEAGRRAALTPGFARLRVAMLTENIRQLLLSGNTRSAFSLARAVGLSGGVSEYLPQRRQR